MIKKIFGSRNDRLIRQMTKQVKKINALEEQFQALTDDQLKAKTTEFRERLEKGETLADIQNEAFAAVAMRFMEDLGVDHSITNVNGGAIALGHPLGATGCMITGTLLDELERRDLSTGLATLCIGGGMGIATIIERV